MTGAEIQVAQIEMVTDQLQGLYVLLVNLVVEVAWLGHALARGILTYCLLLSLPEKRSLVLIAFILGHNRDVSALNPLVLNLGSVRQLSFVVCGPILRD